jgi:hypothetical protein
MIENNIDNIKKIIKGKCVVDILADPEGLIFIYNDGTKLAIKTYAYEINITKENRYKNF